MIDDCHRRTSRSLDDGDDVRGGRSLLVLIEFREEPIEKSIIAMMFENTDLSPVSSIGKYLETFPLGSCQATNQWVLRINFFLNVSLFPALHKFKPAQLAQSNDNLLSVTESNGVADKIQAISNKQRNFLTFFEFFYAQSPTHSNNVANLYPIGDIAVGWIPKIVLFEGLPKTSSSKNGHTFTNFFTPSDDL